MGGERDEALEARLWEMKWREIGTRRSQRDGIKGEGQEAAFMRGRFTSCDVRTYT